MNKTRQEKLAELIHQELMHLPEHQAPATLIPDVLKRIEERKRCWWKQAWTEWPFTARVLLVPTMLVCGGALVMACTALSKLQLVNRVTALASDYLGPMGPGIELITTLGNATLLALQSLEQPWIIGAATVVFLMYLSCVALGTACFRVAAQSH